MSSFMYALTHYPGIIPSILIGALLVFWLLALLGLLDFDHVGPDWLGGHHGAEVHGPDGHGDDTDGGTLMALGLDKLPLSIVASGVAFYWWLLTMLSVGFVLSWLPLPLFISGTLVLIATLVVSVALAAISLRPLRPLFVVHKGVTQESVLGKVCKILTLTVDERFGQAEVPVGQGSPLNLRVYAHSPNTLTKGSTALIIDLDERSGRYRVEAYTAAEPLTPYPRR
jgi:hypothetical protein